MSAKRTHLVWFIIVEIAVLCFGSQIIMGSELASGIDLSKHKATSAIYTWQQATIADWQLPSSWTPSRTTPASSDILIFNTGGITTASNIPSQTLGQLVITGNTLVSLQSSAEVILTIAGDTGDDLVVEQNSALNFNGMNAIMANLASGVTAAINGSMTFSSAATAGHRLTGTDINSIAFRSGSVFTASQGFAGNAFGTTSLNSVVFKSGSTYVCFSGSDPFGATEPNSVVVFQTGSLFSLRTDIPFSQTSFSSGRTYANFELNYPGGEPYLRGTNPLVMDDLTVTAGQLHYWVYDSPSNSIRGNITVAQGASLDCQGSFPGQTINLNGNAQQTITILGGIGVNGGNTFTIDNPHGVTINGRFVAWNLRLVNGIVTFPNPFDYFLVPGTVTRVNGYIDGTLNRRVGLGTYTFDVGTANGYSPVTVEVTAGQDFPLPMLVSAVQTPQPNVLDPSKALSRYWQVQASPQITSANLTFSYLDPADIPVTANESNFVIRKHSNGFTQPVGVVDTQTNTFRVTGLTDLSPADWTLTEPGAVATSTPTASPTATSTPLAAVSGHITYGNAVGAPAQRFVSNVTVTGTGPSTIFTTTIFPNGDYSLTGFQPGAYTVTPSKTDGVNGISSFDAAKIAQHAAGVSILTGNQLVVADVSGNGTISSFDAGQIARYAAGLSGFGSTGNWVFTPANHNYASVTGNIAGEDFAALLMGEVSGNWTNTAAR